MIVRMHLGGRDENFTRTLLIIHYIRLFNSHFSTAQKRKSTCNHLQINYMLELLKMVNSWQTNKGH